MMVTVQQTGSRKPSKPSSSIMGPILKIAIACGLLGLLALSAYSSSLDKKNVMKLTSRQELQNLVEDLRGDDTRVMRWNAAESTAEKQDEMCGISFAKVVAEVLDPGRKIGNESRQLALEYATFCITDNPKQRDIFAHSHEAIHEWVLHWVASDDYLLSATACHVVYIASFANRHNHQAFMENNAVPILSDVVLKYQDGDIVKQGVMNKHQYLTVQIMWAAAALQNLAASYCDTEDDGRCYWEWRNNSSLQVQIAKSSLPVVSDGAKARQEISEYIGNDGRSLISVLLELSCHGPVIKRKSVDNPYPGRAQSPRDIDHPNLLAWAAAGAIKNAVLDSPATAAIVEKDLACFCRLTHTPDWLEKNKAGGVLYHMRRSGNPCHFEQFVLQCVDKLFIDEEGYTCADYKGATKQECQASDYNDSKVLAKDACCGCGGDIYMVVDENGQ